MRLGFCLGRESSSIWSLSDSQQMEALRTGFWMLKYLWKQILGMFSSHNRLKPSSSQPSSAKHHHTSMSRLRAYLSTISTASHPSTGCSIPASTSCCLWFFEETDARHQFQRAQNCHDDSLLFGNCIVWSPTSTLEPDFMAQLSLAKLSLWSICPFSPTKPAGVPQHSVLVPSMHLGLEVSNLGWHPLLICCPHYHQAEASYHQCWLLPTVSKPSW